MEGGGAQVFRIDPARGGVPPSIHPFFEPDRPKSHPVSRDMIRMNRIVTALLMAAIAGTALADPVPVTNTTKRPYKESKDYCNDSQLSKPSKGENIACYNHDACYSDPQGRSRKDCDEGYLRDMKLAGVNPTMALIRFKAVRNWGEASWDRSRKNDEWQ
jgi:hypothetical protein